MARRAWTGDEIAELRRRYPDMPTGDLAREMGRTPHSVYEKAHRLGLSKSAAYLGGPYAGLLYAADASEPTSPKRQPAPPRQDRRKRCSKCGRNLPLHQFSPDLRASDGRQSWCNRCRGSHPPTTYRDFEDIAAEGMALLLYRYRHGLGLYRSDHQSPQGRGPRSTRRGIKGAPAGGGQKTPAAGGRATSFATREQKRQPDPAVRPTSRGFSHPHDGVASTP